MSTRSRSALAQVAMFARNFVQHPKMVGSVIPSSHFLVRRMLRAVPWSQARVLVEYGPGTGVFTTEILRRMRPDATLVAIELNPDFVAFLGRTIRDPRLRLVAGSAAEVSAILAELHLGPADCIISALPYTTMPPAVRQAIFQATHRVLRPRGAFLVLQFSPVLRAELARVFPRIHLAFEPLNLPPAFIYRCVREARLPH